MLSGYSRKIDNNTSSVTIDARKLFKAISEDNENENVIDLPHSTQIINMKKFFSEFGVLYNIYFDAQKHDLSYVENRVLQKDEKNKYDWLQKYEKIIFCPYGNNYCLNSDFTIEKDTILVLSQNNLVLNGHTLHIKGHVVLQGRTTICNGHFSIETCDVTQDVFSTRMYYINNNPLFDQEAQIEFNAVDIDCIDDGSSTTFLYQTLGIPQNENDLVNQIENTGFKILYNACFNETTGFLKDHLSSFSWDTRVTFVCLFLLRVMDTIKKTIETILNTVKIMVKNEAYGKALESIIFKINDEGKIIDSEPSLLTTALIDLMFGDNKEFFKPISILLSELDGKVAKFNNFMKFYCRSTFKMRYSNYYDNLNCNIGVADDTRLYGFHDFITDKYITTDNKNSVITIEHSLIVTKGFTTDSNQGNTIFDLNNKLDVKNTTFILYGVYEFIANNFKKDENLSIYHTKTFEDCNIYMYKSDKFLVTNGGNTLFRNCKIHFYKPVIDTSNLITFRRYHNSFAKKIKVHFDNCEILGSSIAGEDEYYNEDYCKIIINRGEFGDRGFKAIELYINSDDIIKNSNSKEISNIDADLHYNYISNNDEIQHICYIRARQMNIFEHGILVDE